MNQVPFASRKKQVKILFRLICCERKTRFFLKNKLKGTPKRQASPEVTTLYENKSEGNLVAVIKRKGCEFAAPAPAHGVSLDQVQTNHKQYPVD